MSSFQESGSSSSRHEEKNRLRNERDRERRRNETPQQREARLAKRRVKVQAKVIHLGPPAKIDTQKKPLTKQDCIISDSTGTCKLVLWQDNVDKMVVGTSYIVSNLRIKKFADAQFLSFTVDTTWNIVNDIGEVCHQTDDNPPLSQYNQLTVCGEIVSVIYNEQHKCPLCDWKMCMEIS